MTPILYEKDEIDFTSQGLGSLVEIYDVDVEEQRNGLLQLTASYPVSGVRYADISVGRIILAKPNQRDDVHAFRIVSTELDISGYAVTIEADSITYDLTHNLVKHLNASGNGQAFMTALKNAVVNPSIFAFYSDIVTSSTTSLDYVNPMEAIMGTTGSFLQIWGGELKRENRRVAMFNRRGRDNVATFRLGKNISGLKYSVDISSLVTRIIPTKSVQNDDQTTTTLEGTPVDSQYINNYEQIYTLPLEFTDDSIKTVADLNVAAKGWFTQNANTGRDKPTVTIDIDVLSLQDSADYQDKFKNLESVSLTDTVTVYVPEYGVNVTAIVNELHYDPILDRVTKMTVGTAKQSFADSSRTQLSDLQDKIISVQNQADATAVSANGKNKNYYGSVQPSHPQEGDQWYWQDGDKSGIKQFINGEWMPLIDSNTQEKIEAGVNEAIAQANENTATAIEQNNISQQEVMNDIAKSQADLAIKDGDFNNKAQAMADKALSDAKANTATVAQETLDTANQNLATAKGELTDGLQKEVSDRTSAVIALDTKAQGYVDTAKIDVLQTVNKEVTDRQNAVTALDTKAQDYANTAKTDALNALTEEVTNRQNAVSALDTKATNAVNQAKSDINETINSLSVGGRNYLTGTINKISTVGANADNQSKSLYKITLSSLDALYKEFKKTSDYYTLIFDWEFTGTNPSGQFIPQWNMAPFGIGGEYTVISSDNTSGTVILTANINGNWSGVSSVPYMGIRFDNVPTTGTINIYNMRLMSGNLVYPWTQAPEDVVLDYTTKDSEIKTTISQYQTTNDGKVIKAQTDATTALGQVATKVSQTDYDTKTGDLTTKYTQVKQTTDSQATDIVDIKETATSQASKINSISSDVDGTKQSISDIETTQDSQSDKINQITTDVNGTKQSITDIQTKDGQQDTRMGTIETSVSGVKSDFSTYKTDANGRISTAQTTAQTAVDGLKTKVSQTDYNTKTGQLQTDLTTTTQTANKAKTDIVSIQQKDGDQDARMTQIESDASGVKTTVSDLKTTQGQQSGSISTLQQRADGFETTVQSVQSIVNNLGQTNQLINTEFTPDFSGWLRESELNSIQPSINFFSLSPNKINGSNILVIDTTKSSGRIINNLIPITIYDQVSFSAIVGVDSNYTGAIAARLSFYNSDKVWIGSSNGNTATNSQSMTIVKQENIQLPSNVAYVSLSISFSKNDGNIYLSQPMMVFNGTVGKYSLGTYSNSLLVARSQLTADTARTEISDYKTDADGRISKAQSDITQTANQVATKVSQNDYNAKTGELTTGVNNVTQTANQSKQDIVAIQQKDGDQDARMNTIESDASGTKQTVSNIQTKQGQQDTSITTLQTRSDGIEASVTGIKNSINNLGQINQLINTEFSPDFQGWYKEGTNELENSFLSLYRYKYLQSNVMRIDTSKTSGRIINGFVPVNSDTVISFSGYAKVETGYAGAVAIRINFYDSEKNWVGSSDGSTATNSTAMVYIKQENILIQSGISYISFGISFSSYASYVYISKPMLVFDSKIGNYSSGNYNNNGATAKAQLTADLARTELTNYKTDADGRITKAQSDVTQTAALVATKVSQSDYDKKTGQLSTDVSNAQQTANSAVTTIGSYKTSNDNRVAAAETKISQNANDITLRATTSDLNAAKSDYTAQIAQVKVDAQAVTTTVSNLQAKVNSMGQINQLINTEFSPDFQGWIYESEFVNKSTTYTDPSNFMAMDSFKYRQSNIAAIIISSGKYVMNNPIRVPSSSTSVMASAMIGVSPTNNGVAAIRIKAYDANRNVISQSSVTPATTSTSLISFKENIELPTGTTYVGFVITFSGTTGSVRVSKPMLVFDTSIGDYSQGNYNNNNKVATQQVTIDGITSIVSDPTKGLSVRVQTAEGTLNTVKSTADGAMSKASQTANDITREIENRETGDSNTLQSSKDFTQSSITSAVNGVNSTITQTSDSLIAKINTKTDSDTVLSLLKNNWSIGIADNIGAITSGIVGNASQMSLISKNITLDGNTTVTGDFYAKGGNFTNLNASNITVGTLNGNQVNITNLNASNIVSGAISGANLNINLNTGQVQFQKGRIFKSDYTTDINIDQGYISTADSNTRVLLKSGQMQFVAPNVFDLQNTPYLKVYNGMGGSGNTFAGANLSGRDYIALYNSANSSNVFDAPIGTETFSGISTGKSSTGNWVPTKVGGADRGVLIAGGNTDNWLIVERSPYIFVGSDANGTSAYGNRVYVHADYFHVPTVYSHGGSTGANVYVASDGAILKSSSATKYKTNIEHETDSVQGDQLLTIDPATWNDKFESEQLEHYHETGVEPERKINMEGKRYYGIIAEDLAKAGLEELVTRNEETDEVEGVEYSKIGVALIPIVRDLRNKLNEQAVEIERLKDKIK
ncbi:MAG: gp58-like family protein [Leuconostoc mesenteroides]|jgi:phage minor structural protein|nr:gp58-like family protein [Leuconostoc mesenteroides]MCI1878486.1 gp58-like family protein [Leuconostoc mesenteroides]MCI1908027.1 gp58-like family protein [Leuconostoc mesenteroides]